MAVETYLDEENQPLVHDVEELDKWKELIEQCGLEGQKTLTKEDKSPIPFPVMTEQMEKTYSTLCPIKTKVEEYSKTPIPVRVLSLIALCRQEQYFEEIQIWSDDKSPDPIAVGVRKDGDSTWRKIYHIIGRWGDELRSFPELLQLAKKRFLEQKTARLKERHTEIEHQLKNIETLVDSEFNGRSIFWRD